MRSGLSFTSPEEGQQVSRSEFGDRCASVRCLVVRPARDVWNSVVSESLERNLSKLELER